MPYSHEKKTKYLLLGLIHCPDDLKDIPASIRDYVSSIQDVVAGTPSVFTEIVDATTTISTQLKEQIEQKNIQDKILHG